MEKYKGFIVSCPRNFEENAAVETEYLISDKLNHVDVEVKPIYELTGLCIAHFNEDPEEVLLELINLLREEPLFTYILKLVPIGYKFETRQESFKEIGKEYNEEINPSDKWRITIRRRNSPIGRDIILDATAEHIENGIVDLENPDYYVQIEVIGEQTYSSLNQIPELSIKKYERDKEEYLQTIIP